MKTPDEIKKGLECCPIKEPCSWQCPYYRIEGCGVSLLTDALAYIQQLESQINVLIPEAALFEEAIAAGEKYKRERDAAVRDLYDYGMLCELCLHENKPIDEEPCKSCAHASTVNSHTNWQWRGVQEVE